MWSGETNYKTSPLAIKSRQQRLDKTGILEKITGLLGSSVISFEPQKEARNSVFKIHLQDDSVWFLKQLPHSQHFHEASVADIDSTLIPQASVPKVLIFENDNQKFALLSNVPYVGSINVSSNSNSNSNSTSNNNNELVVRALRQVHTMPQWPQLVELTLPAVSPLIDAYLPNSPSQVYEKLQQIESSLTGSDFQGALHGDLSKGNIYLTNDKKVGLIDWEFSAIGDVRWDLAALAVEHALPRAEFSELLKQYCQVANYNCHLFLREAEYWLVYYWLVTMDWSEQNEFKTLDYRNLTQDMKSIIQ